MCLYLGQQPKDCFIQSNEIDVSDLCVVKEKKEKRKPEKIFGAGKKHCFPLAIMHEDCGLDSHIS